MCWSFEVSLLSGLFSYTIALYLWMRNFENDRWHSIILFVFSTIQFWEAGIWWYENNNKSNTPYIFIAMAFLIPLTLALEPVASLYGAKYMGKKIDYYDIVIYSGVFLYLFYSISKNNSFPNVVENGGIEYTKSDNNELSISIVIFLILVIYPLLKYNDFQEFYVVSSLLLLGLLGLATLRGHAIASQWCLYSNALAAMMLFYPYLV